MTSTRRFAAALPFVAHAAPVAVASYDAPNGSGQASGGNFNYWDLAYSGSGATTTDGAPLAGGTGDLTDGVIATQSWFAVENAAGTGPYVGYADADPTITFRFAAPTSFATATFHFDVANFGGVVPPTAIDVGLLAFALPAFVGDAPRSFTADLSSLAPTDTLAVTFHRGDRWVFVSEVQFTAAPVPEPSSGGADAGRRGGTGRAGQAPSGLKAPRRRRRPSCGVLLTRKSPARPGFLRGAGRVRSCCSGIPS